MWWYFQTLRLSLVREQVLETPASCVLGELAGEVDLQEAGHREREEPQGPCEKVAAQE